LPGRLGEEERGQYFKRFLEEHILILPGSLKALLRKGVKIYKICLAKHMNLSESLERRRKGQIFQKYSCRTHF